MAGVVTSLGNVVSWVWWANVDISPAPVVLLCSSIVVALAVDMIGATEELRVDPLDESVAVIDWEVVVIVAAAKELVLSCVVTSEGEVYTVVLAVTTDAVVPD